MRKNTVKQALAEGKLQLGTGFGQLRSPEVAKILAAAGFQWAFIDTEHGGFDLETVQDICRTAVMVGLSPVGIRGYGLGGTQVDYEKVDIPQVIEHMNANTMVVMQIETQRALDMREELLAVPGIDAVMVGPADLSISLGVPGEFQHPKMVAAMEAIRASCVSHGIAPGVQTRSAALARFWKERGMLFLGCSNDSGMLYERAVQLVGEIGKG